MGQKSVKGKSKDPLWVFPAETLAVLFVSRCRIPAVVSFLETLRALAGTVARASARPTVYPHKLFLKRLEFNQNINFLLDPFKAQSAAACFLFHMPSDETCV